MHGLAPAERIAAVDPAAVHTRKPLGARGTTTGFSFRPETVVFENAAASPFPSLPSRSFLGTHAVRETAPGEGCAMSTSFKTGWSTTILHEIDARASGASATTRPKTHIVEDGLDVVRGARAEVPSAPHVESGKSAERYSVARSLGRGAVGAHPVQCASAECAIQLVRRDQVVPISRGPSATTTVRVGDVQGSRHRASPRWSPRPRLPSSLVIRSTWNMCVSCQLAQTRVGRGRTEASDHGSLRQLLARGDAHACLLRSPAAGSRR